MLRDKGIVVSKPEVPLDPNFLVELANRIFLSGCVAFDNTMDNVCNIPIHHFTADIVEDCNYVMRAYFPTVSYTNLRVRLGRRFPIHRMECKETCLLPAVVLNTSILGHTLYALQPSDAIAPNNLDAIGVGLGTGSGFMHDCDLWISFLPESLDNDYMVMIQAESPYASPVARDKIVDDVCKQFNVEQNQTTKK